MKNNPDISYLFEPRAVAVIGASSHPGKIGYKLVENTLFMKYPGKIYPINPGGGEILGVPVYKNLSDVEGEIDLATIVIPAKFTYDAVVECAKKGVKFLSIITSGFSEIGNLEEEKKIVSCAHENGMRVLGPNIFGLYSAFSSLNATFGPKDVSPGNVAIITQSGALGIAMMGKTKTENIGLSAIVSVGNKSDLDEADLLEYLVPREEVGVIMMYIEGVKNGERLVGILKDAAKKKPVIVIKSGRSKRGAVAAASHTGSLAGADGIFSDVMKQCGVIRAECIEEALNWCKFLAKAPKPMGENSIIITNGGGMGVLATDACEKYNVNLYDDIEILKNTFSTVVPEFGSVKNPIDITGGAPIEDYDVALDAAMDSREINSIICLGCETAVFDAKRLAVTLDRYFLNGKSKKPIVFSFFGGPQIDNCISEYRNKVPIFFDVYEAVSCLGALYANYNNQKSKTDAFDTGIIDRLDNKAIEEIIKKVRADKRQFLLSYEAEGLMKAAGIAMPATNVARNMKDAVWFAEKTGYPVVMKVVSRDILHKTDAGGVALDILNKNEVIDAYEAIMHSCKRYNPDAIIEGIEIAEMVKPGAETIIGARMDNSFGPIVMFGLGGIYVEVMKDVVFRAFPIGRTEVLNMIAGIRSYPLLLGARGEAKKDIPLIADTILRVGAVLHRHRDISDIEINPLIAYPEGEGVKALDARILLSKTEQVAI
jgi:acetate---CoA ligase (ADP-forming)